jgi:hypothetical protein
VPEEIRHRHLAREQKRDRAREQSQHQRYAAEHFKNARDAIE